MLSVIGKGRQAAQDLIRAGRWMMRLGLLLLPPLSGWHLSLWSVAAIPLVAGFALYGAGRIGLIELDEAGRARSARDKPDAQPD